MPATNGYNNGSTGFWPATKTTMVVGGCWPALETARVVGGGWPAMDAPMQLLVTGQE